LGAELGADLVRTSAERSINAMKHSVTRFKSLTAALKELEPFIRNPEQLQTGKPLKQFGGLRPRELQMLAISVNRAARTKLGRSLSIRQVDAGSCNGCELEIHALSNAFYDLERFGLRFVASPRHADVLMVTGPVTKNMREALLRTYNATPDPKWVVAVGACAADAGIFAGSYAVAGGVKDVIPVDLHIHGCPPSPITLLEGLLALLQHANGRWTR
jgi:Ni,Fe-hydrogenase III small subunit